MRGVSRMSSGAQTDSTLDDLLLIDGKAELIGGRIVPIMPTGRRPNLIAGRIFRSLAGHVDLLGIGETYTDNMGFVVPELSTGRRTFSPDVSYFVGPFPPNVMRFIDGPPTFAVEVRSEGDYGPAAEAEMAAKRADYFEAGTQLVWDVDSVVETIRIYRAVAIETFEVYRRGQVVTAEPAVPGWHVAVDWIFS
jgi:Uma2 family endonuclease